MTTTLAIVASAPGGPEMLTLIDHPRPEPSTGEVLIEVAAAGVNRPDVMQRTGALPPPPGVTEVLGLEVAGHVAALGPGATGFEVGQPVMALLDGGGYARHAVAAADLCLPVPDGLDLAEAAVLPEGLFTLWHNMFERGGLTAGDTVLIHGGASGIGTLGLQLAQAVGARVIVTAGGSDKCARLSDMGAEAIDYREGDHAPRVLDLTGDAGVDVVIDIVGGETVGRNLDCLAPGGRHVSLSFMAGPLAEIDFSKLMRKGLWLTSSTLRPKPPHEKARIAREVAAHLLPLIGPGKVRPVISRRFPLAEAGAAHTWLESGENFGKVVLTTA